MVGQVVLFHYTLSWGPLHPRCIARGLSDHRLDEASEIMSHDEQLLLNSFSQVFATVMKTDENRGRRAMGAVGPSIQSLFIVLGCACWGPAKAHPLSLECLLAPGKSWARQLLQPLAF